MTDTERLATDRAYWDEIAPEGATHYQPQQQMFYKRNGKDSWRVYSNRWWKSPATSDSALWVKRPKQWIDGLPPVGTECEVNDVDHGWISATVIAYDEDEGVAVCKTVYGYDGYGELRPIRTPEQREQEALALSIQNAMECVTRRKLHDEDSFAVANILTVAGYRKADDK